MELRINLADHEEVAAGVSLLQTILHAARSSSAVAPLPLGTIMPGFLAHMDGKTGDLAGHSAKVEGGILTPNADAAQVFGAATVPPASPAASTGAGTGPQAGMNGAPSTSMSGPALPAAPAPSVELDKAGLPWDERIHAGTKTKITDGTWKKKKGVDAATVATVEAELRARVAGSAAPGVPPAPFVPPVATLPPAPPAAPSASVDPTTFEQLMPRITPLVTTGALPPTALQQACTTVGLQSIVALQANPAYVPTVWATLKASNPGVAF